MKEEPGAGHLECSKCENSINTIVIPFGLGLCWPCTEGDDRQWIKDRLRCSPSIIERNYLRFIERYEKDNQVSFVATRTMQTHEYDWQRMCRTDSKGDIPEPKFVPHPNDKRRHAPGLE